MIGSMEYNDGANSSPKFKGFDERSNISENVS